MVSLSMLLMDRALTHCDRLIFIWFGLDGKGIDVSGEFHPILG
jgi:hypothetical protein